MKRIRNLNDGKYLVSRSAFSSVKSKRNAKGFSKSQINKFVAISKNIEDLKRENAAENVVIS